MGARPGVGRVEVGGWVPTCERAERGEKRPEAKEKISMKIGFMCPVDDILVFND